MAFDQTLVPSIPGNIAGTDHRNNRFKAVQVVTGRVLLADAASVAACGTYVLGNAPNSGQACELIGLPNVSRVIVASAVPEGAWMVPFSTTGLFAQTSLGNVAALGTALETVTASGQLVAMHIRR